MKKVYKMKNKSTTSSSNKHSSFLKSMLKFKRSKASNLPEQNAISLRKFSTEKHKSGPHGVKHSISGNYESDVYEEINLELNIDGSIAESDPGSSSFKQNKNSIIEESENENENENVNF